jgi:L-lysine exporter family protein LysE/ArgO
VIALFPGLLTGLSLIIAIGAQNAFVIRQGLAKSHILLVVIFCSLCDALLIFLGTGGLGTLIQSKPGILEFIRWFGVIYLSWFGIKSLRSAFKQNEFQAGAGLSSSRKSIVLSLIGFTFLNPHVYLDTVILVGSVANQFHSDRWYFALGASIGSILWFTSIGYGAQAASKYMSRPIFWKVLDIIIAIVMFSVAILLAFYRFNS